MISVPYHVQNMVSSVSSVTSTEFMFHAVLNNNIMTAALTRRSYVESTLCNSNEQNNWRYD